MYIVNQNKVFSVKLLFQTTRGSNSVSKNWAQVLMPYQVLAELSWGFAGPVSQGPGGRSSGTWWRLGKIFWQKNCCSTTVRECPHGPSILLDILSRTIDEVMMVQCISTNRVHVKDQIHHLIIRMQPHFPHFHNDVLLLRKRTLKQWFQLLFKLSSCEGTQVISTLVRFHKPPDKELRKTRWRERTQ